jgi:hypothetical protein
MQLQILCEYIQLPNLLLDLLEAVHDGYAGHRVDLAQGVQAHSIEAMLTGNPCILDNGVG